MLDIKTLLLITVLTVLLSSVLEAAVIAWRKPGSYDFRAAAVSLQDMVLRNAMRLAFPAVIASPMGAWLYEHRVGTIALDGPGAWALLFLVQEFCYYWYHRASHRVRLMWCTHGVHHSPNQLNLSAAYRLGWTAYFSGASLFFAPMIWLGFAPQVVLACVSVNLLYQFWLHATWIPKLGPLEWVLNTPSAHRVHHAANLEYLDANYGGVLIVFDRLFGTFRAERDDLPCRYGWVQPMQSHNPIKVELHLWATLARDVLRARSPSEAVSYVLRPPGWRANEGDTTEDLRRRAALPQGSTP
jgi:sterol desaturase/sphingolipid hydroxylase (fatty acid hydroxylase superfamily)